MKGIARTGIFPVLFFLLASSLPLGAQYTTRSWLSWRTVETNRFVFHYPSQLEEWTIALAKRADAIDASVARIVGFAPPQKTHVVVDDPYNTANGSAWPFIGRPVISLWATPPDPREDIGEYRNWGATLLSHEFTHVAHLSRPSRNSFLRSLWQLGPVNLGPITLNAPRWVIEGYATYAEGKLTGSGRPHGSWRPAYLRQWALEGALPRYEQLNSLGGYEGGEFAYLAGSAFLEWLAARQGDSSLVAVWRRMTAKQQRAFDEAFTGVYGESARTLYGRFTAELTGSALEIERKLRAIAPGDTGQVVQRLSWSTGDPAISRDGRRIAIQLASPTVPSRIIIWSTAAEPDTGRAKRDSILRASDPEDVPARLLHPLPKRVLATLRANTGAPYEHPRFLTDGRVLVSRYMRVGDGSLKPDLFIWNPQTRTVRRVTRGSSIQRADPSPDGRSAVAMKCTNGWCDVVRVDLVTGSDSVIARGNPNLSYFRPRFSPDGSRILVSYQEQGRWQLSVLGGRRFELDGNTYDAAWVGNGQIVATNDASGIPNLVRIDLESGTVRPTTHVTGAAVGAERNPADSSIWFLSFYSRGYDLRRIRASNANDTTTIALNQRLLPAAMMPSLPARDLDTNAVSSPRPYGLSPRLFRWFPLPAGDADGVSGTFGIGSSDLVDRSEILAKGAFGDRAAWRGGALDLTWKGMRPFLRAELFDAAQPTQAVHMRGGLFSIDHTHAVESWSARLRLGGSAAALVGDTSSSRTMVVGELGGTFLQRSGTRGFTETVTTSFTAGHSFDTDFTRSVSSLGITAFGFAPVSVSAAATYGRTSSDAPRFEQIALGGGPTALLDRLLLTQRVNMPALPQGIAVGTSAFAYRLSLATQPLNVYWWAGSTAPAGDRFAAWHRVVGLEGSQSVAAIPIAGLPTVRAVYGVGESLDAPFKKQLRGYFSIVLNP
jgi:Tol biopolymer transport system component